MVGRRKQKLEQGDWYTSLKFNMDTPIMCHFWKEFHHFPYLNFVVSVFKFQGVYTHTHIYVYIYIPNLYSGGCHVNQPAGWTNKNSSSRLMKVLALTSPLTWSPAAMYQVLLGGGGGWCRAAERKKCHELPKWIFVEVCAWPRIMWSKDG